MRRFHISKLILFSLIGIIIGQNHSPYLDIANELLVRKKLSKKLPDVFDDVKFSEMVDNIDNIAQINSKTHADLLSIQSPEFHWCYAQTYHLAGLPAKSLDHYRQYKIQTLDKTVSIHKLFQKDINELEVALENQQTKLAYDIYETINSFKSEEETPSSSQIQELQKILNTFNELNSNSRIILSDGIMGSQTKSAVYDFEENNPYFVSPNGLQSVSVASLEISSSQSSIKPVLAIPQLEPQTRQNAIAAFSSVGNPISLSTTIIVDADKIKSIPAASIAELLEYVIGVNIKSHGASDVLANISTFGGTGEQTLILVDGLKISNQQTLHHDLDLPINIDDIKQIEIYRNAAARQYGSGAVSGVVNIITKKGDERNSYLATEYGDYSLLNGNLMVNIPIGKSFHNLSFTSLSSSGYKTNTDFLKNTFYYKYYLQDGKTSTNFSFGYLTRGNGIINHLDNVYQNQYEKNSTKFFNSKIHWDFGRIKLESNTHWFDHRDELASNKEIGGWDNYSNTETGVNFNANSKSKWGNRKTGFTFNRETNSNTTVKEITRDHYTFTFQEFILSKKINFDFGFSSNYYDDFGWFAAPGYQLVYNINNNANIYHKYNRGFRLPSFYEMYADDYIYNGNKGLIGESINAFEYGIQIYGSAIRMTASQFYKNSENVIDWYTTTSGNIKTWKAASISDVLTSGHNMQLELYPKIIKRLNFVNRFELGYAYLDIEHNGEKDEYKNVSHYLKHQVIFGISYHLPFGISRSWYVRYEQPITYDNRTIIDTQIHYSIWRIESTLNINNVFNVEYEDVEDITLPGRWIRFSLRYNL